MFFIANSIVEQPAERNKAVNRVIRQRKRASALTKIGPESNSTRRNIRKRHPFPDIVEALEVHDPVPLETKESFHFGTHHQQSYELNSDFVVALKQLSTLCIYNDFRIEKT